MGGRILAMGGGTAGGPAEDYLLSLSGENRPRVCFLSTPSAHRPEYVEVFYDAFRHRRCAPYHVELFGVPDAPAERVAEADIVCVSGGNTANALALWRLHQVDAALREVWGRNGVLGGWSAGAICWFENGITDSFGARLAPLNDGLGLLSARSVPTTTAMKSGGRPFSKPFATESFPQASPLTRTPQSSSMEVPAKRWRSERAQAPIA